MGRFRAFLLDGT